MCGIIGMFNIGEKNENVNDPVIEQYQDQRTRGTEGFGTIFIDKEKNYKVKRSTNETKAIIDLSMNESPGIIFHHRTPTSSENKISQTHPILVANGSLKNKYLVIHNGIIRNEDKLKEQHEKLGFIYTTQRKNKNDLEEFNDSESLAIEIARYIEGQSELIEIEGSAAFIAVQINAKNNKVKEIYFGRNKQNPLKLAASRNKIWLSSEGKGEEVKENMLYHFNMKDYKIKKNKLLFKEELEEKITYMEDEWTDEKLGRFEDKKTQTKINYKTSYGREINRFDGIDDAEDMIELEKEEEEIEEIIEEMTRNAEEITNDLEDVLRDPNKIFATKVEPFLNKMIINFYEAKGKMQNIQARIIQKKINIEKTQEENLKKLEEEVNITTT